MRVMFVASVWSWLQCLWRVPSSVSSASAVGPHRLQHAAVALNFVRETHHLLFMSASFCAVHVHFQDFVSSLACRDPAGALLHLSNSFGHET